MPGKQLSQEPIRSDDVESDDEADVTIAEQNEDWVASSLKQLYRSTVEEGIPDDMLALLDALDDDDADGKSDADDMSSTAKDRGEQ